MLIDELFSLLPRPAQPREQGTAAKWGTVTSKLGGPLPTDYMQFVDHYGSGTINGFLTVFNPFSSNPHVNLLDQVFVQLSALRELRTNFPNEFELPLFFEPGGLLPWAASDDGDVFCWSTVGESGAWEVVTVPRSDSPERFKLSMSQFLARGLTGQVKSSALSPYFASGTGSFEPHPA
ncbi:hypothetical protein C7T35_38050 [Variovorax sp. WS11]|uniref:SMI1/KNR4 family protein n=1 Tax=Variovorax sp. WS11 TaxID=1105204 RepID=UPI000D0C9D39|nr:SMI1/KNR4 family protein [Variovorax sp. WS11]NDZ19001.1 hypothetical protein [Variovorax sp. WS11]PSL79329.1 hypothetical protein C7T35_38050 [Variovorax sp. WS11]